MRPPSLRMAALALCALASCAAPPQLQLAVFTAQGTARWGEGNPIAASPGAPAVDHKVAFVYASPTPLHHARLVLNAPMPRPSLRTLFGLDEPDEASGWELAWDLDRLRPGVVAIWSFDDFRLGNGKGAAFESCRVVTSVDLIYGEPPRRVRVEIPLRLPDATALDIEPACLMDPKPVAKP